MVRISFITALLFAASAIAAPAASGNGTDAVPADAAEAVATFDAVEPIVTGSETGNQTDGAPSNNEARSVSARDWNWDPINFSGGVTVKGNSHLTIRSDGTYTFSGKFHDSGFFSYNTAIAWVVKDSEGVAYTFKHKGKVCGTIGFCSRTHTWNINGHNNDIAHRWSRIAAGSHGTARAAAKISFIDIINIIRDLIATLGPILREIAVI